MKRILIISGSRADYGLLEWPAKVLGDVFDVMFVSLTADEPSEAFLQADEHLRYIEPDCLLILGDRWEILQTAIAAHLRRVPIAHIAGGDITLGSYDHSMRDCISRLATYHFPTSPDSMSRLPYEHVHMIGNIALDFILDGGWRGERPDLEPYVVVNYQPETIDGTVEWDLVVDAIAGRRPFFFSPNQDQGAERVDGFIARTYPWAGTYTNMPRAEYLNFIYHCEELIGNSSSLLYEAPALGVKTRMIGKRQVGRVAPTGDGKASERILEVLCQCL